MLNLKYQVLRLATVLSILVQLDGVMAGSNQGIIFDALSFIRQHIHFYCVHHTVIPYESISTNRQRSTSRSPSYLDMKFEDRKNI